MDKHVWISDCDGYVNDSGNYVEIYLDNDCTSPREWCNLGTFYTWMHSAISPDDNPFYGFDDLGESFGINCEDDPNESIPKFNDKVGVCVPVFAISHSGIAYKAAWSNPFHDPWDSGFVGVIFVTKERIREMLGVKRVTKKIRHQVVETLIAEVDEYNEWASGNCYGFTVYDENGDMVDCCGGFIGSDAYESGLAEQCGGLNEVGMGYEEWLDSKNTAA